MARKLAPPQPSKHHYIRTALAALLGAFAMILVSASILVVWANRTLTDNATYVAAVGPLLARPELQDYIATKITDQVLEQAPISDVATQLLPPGQTDGKTPDQLRPMVQKLIHDKAQQALQSPAVQTAWRTTNQSAQADLIRQLDAGAETVHLDMAPLVNAVLAQLQQEKLVPAKADAINLPSDKAMVTLNGNGLKQVRNVYHALKTGAPAVVVLTLLFAALSVWASVHHLKTLRRMLVSTGVSGLLVAGVLALPGHVALPKADPETGRVAAAIVATLLHGLQMGCLVLGVVCVALAIGTKVWERRQGHLPAKA